MMDAATLTIVLPIRIVTSNLLGYSRRRSKYLPMTGLPEILFFSFFLSNENKATSEPEKKAENRKRKIRIISLICQSMSKY
jgi:hypothetical protein